MSKSNWNEESTKNQFGYVNFITLQRNILIYSPMHRRVNVSGICMWYTISLKLCLYCYVGQLNFNVNGPMETVGLSIMHSSLCKIPRLFHPCKRSQNNSMAFLRRVCRLEIMHILYPSKISLSVLMKNYSYRAQKNVIISTVAMTYILF